MENKENTNEEAVIEKSEIEELVEEIAKEQPIEETVVDSVEEIAAEIAAETTENIVEDTAEESVEEVLGDAVENITEEVTEEVENEAIPVKKSKLWLYVLGGIGAFVILLTVAYFAVASHYSDKFLIGTTVNGINCAGKSVDDVKSMFQKEVEEYTLTIETANKYDVTIKGTEIGIKYNGVDVLEDAMKEQNHYLWIKALFQKKSVKAKIDFDYDEKKLDEAINKADFMKPENQTAPVSAIPVYKDGKYDIQSEVYGTLIDREKIYESAHKAVSAMDKSMNLTAENCYVQPTLKKDSKQVIEARDALNKCLKTSITYSLDGIEVKVDKSMIEQWISVDPTSLAVNVDAAKVRAFTDTLGGKYNTPNKTGQLTTPTGKVVTIPNAQLGRVVGAAAECEQLMNEVKTGETIVREPLLSQTATPDGTASWGATYIEVDITAQHMWYIENGAVVFECDVVTGAPGRDTPVGSFKILEKLRNKTLRGNIMPNGKPEYITPVSYWARVTWSGIGFHDAEWQWPPKGQGFGGELYKQGYGSHGCINMALKDVSVFYEKIQVGCPVLIHY